MAPRKKFKVSDPSNDKENIFLHNVNNFQSKIRRRESIRIKQKKVREKIFIRTYSRNISCTLQFNSCFSEIEIKHSS